MRAGRVGHGGQVRAGALRGVAGSGWRRGRGALGWVVWGHGWPGWRAGVGDMGGMGLCAQGLGRWAAGWHYGVWTGRMAGRLRRGLSAVADNFIRAADKKTAKRTKAINLHLKGMTLPHCLIILSPSC